MPLVCLGLSHHSAPVEVRERHAVPAARMAEALVALCDYETVREAVMVSTCNRMEIYAELNEYETGLAQLKQFVQNFRHGAVSDIQSYLYTHLGHSAAEHLFRVATGLDSMLIGEAEILGQLKSAYSSAQHAKTVGPILHELFRTALQVGKRARSRTGIGEASLSVATAAVETARSHLPTLEGIRAVVIGAGRMGQLAARRLNEFGAGEIIVANRTVRRAQQIADAIGVGRAITLNELDDALVTADVVITAAGAAQFLVTPEHIERVGAKRQGRTLVIIDIAVPRDVDPDVGLLPQVQLIDIDALRDVVEDRLERRRAAIPQVEQHIAEHLDRFSLWYRTRTAIVPAAKVAQSAEHIREEEIMRLFGRCTELDERERSLIIGASKRILSRLLHAPFAQLRSLAAADLAGALTLGKALAALFDEASELPAPVVAPAPVTALPRSEGRLVMSKVLERQDV